ncbi:30S ribosomal protein S19 [Candidatus Hodgkinia cicadicola]|uniref:Small ribosomal subunit protein uS19 n=1 Tax=Candidatus Hodgkinia cicadicola TaxID=573658 RepID=A0ABX4MFZ3_9HYPH|nr:30S ribosomal protein S19 [Candidatus Hodgkinia cicadicola]PIM96880.1 30S ribosomal protein S19 [Candidatus Hodgkinia cicadicola]
MARSTWKPPFVSNKILKRCHCEVNTKTWNRSAFIIPEFVDKTFEVHNGIMFNKIKITTSTIGYKLGEFSFTRKPCMHSG